MLYKLPIIDVQDFFPQYNLKEEELSHIKNNSKNQTCAAALVNANLIAETLDSDILVKNNREDFIINYNNLDKATANYCIPPNTIKGVINFGSPLLLFYSDLFSEDSKSYYLSNRLAKYFMDNDMFFIIVNYIEDPIGIPSSNEYLVKNFKAKDSSGIIYNKTDFKSLQSAIFAHEAYFKNPKTFSKAVVTTFEEGHEAFYGIEKK